MKLGTAFLIRNITARERLGLPGAYSKDELEEIFQNQTPDPEPIKATATVPTQKQNNLEKQKDPFYFI